MLSENQKIRKYLFLLKLRFFFDKDRVAYLTVSLRTQLAENF